MKKITLFITVISISLFATAQSKTEIYIQKTPALPHDSCNISKIGADNFISQVKALKVQVDNEIKLLNKQAKSYASTNGQASVDAKSTQITQQYGLTPEDMAKLKDKNTTEAEKKEIANKIMMQQTNMTVDEAKSMSNMSPAGKQAYSEAYATEMAATQMTNPQQKSTNEDAKNSYQLLSEQQVVMNKISANTQKISKLYEDIESDPVGPQMLENIDKWHNKQTAMSGVDYGQGKQIDSLEYLIKSEKIKYCDRFTPKYRDALRQHLAILKSSLPDYVQLAEINNKVNKAQTGMSNPPETTDIMSLGAYQGYLEKLIDAYKFKLYYPENK